MNPLVDAFSLRALLGTPELIVVDCRFDLLAPAAGHARYGEGHVPGARYASLDTDLAGPRGPGDGRHPLPEPEAFAETLRGLGVSRSSRVVAYDDASGAIAARLWWMLRWLGHDDVAVLDGGLAAWLEADGPLDTTEPDNVRGDFEIRDVVADSVVDTAGVERALAHGAVLLDARAAPRFAGETEPIDTVAGHVPGARNLPFTALLGPDGRFLPAAALRARLETALAGARPEDAVTMCGSGVTACHVLLGMAQAGLTGARLYAGSWSAWIADPGRPVATEAG